jgi:Homing endonuclease associated repeat
VPRYSDAQILDELAGCAERLGRSPTMREFSGDPRVRMHPQTVVARFGTWNAAKRRAGLIPRRFATRDELLAQLRELGNELGRTPTGRDLDERRERCPSKSLYWHRFGSFTNALRAAGFDVPRRDERAERALREGERLARRLGRLPRLADWKNARDGSSAMLSEWQVYRLFAAGRSGWPSYLKALRGRLAGSGVQVGADGRLLER